MGEKKEGDDDGMLRFDFTSFNRPEDSRSFSFDFRYYLNYYKQTQDEREGGLYIFKSILNDSLPFNHSVSSITAYQGKIMSMFTVQYQSRMN